MTVSVTKYPEKVELFMQRFYRSLNEKDQRHYAALEAHRLRHGGINYVATIIRLFTTNDTFWIDRVGKKMTCIPQMQYATQAVGVNQH